MEEKSDHVEEEMLPGFRFHPTDEELVGFYLTRKIQHRALAIELIKQVDIYKYDPWDLPKLATTGEKEWYFYCPRDRKYRNSARPNRVTGAGFWKATGTDRPIYSSEGSKCIGLKKSLVFYRGRAAKGIKTDWMMHEFRLPPLPDHSPSPPPHPPKKLLLDKTLPPNEAWAICRIFKKTNSMAQRALSHPWMSAPMLPAADNSSHIFNHNNSEVGSSLVFQQQSMFPFPACATNNNFIFPPIESSIPPKTLQMSDPSKDSTTSESLEFSGFSICNLQHSLESSADQGDDLRKNNNINNQWVGIGIGIGNGMRSSSIGFPFSLPTDDDVWDTVVHPGGDMSSTTACYSTNKCYT